MMTSRMLKCDECGAEWKANYGNTWYFMASVYDSKQCRDDAAARWQVAHGETEDADAQAVANLQRAAGA